MKTTVELSVTDATREEIWSILSDIEHAADNIRAIKKIEILERPSNSKESLVGLKWMETRTMFGQEATETIWITECVEKEYYKTRAVNHGAIYTSHMFIRDGDEKNEGSNRQLLYVGMTFEGQPQTCCAKVMTFLMGWMMKRAMVKSLMQDLEDIKTRLAESKKKGN
jgi:hypothetical protein